MLLGFRYGLENLDTRYKFFWGASTVSDMLPVNMAAAANRPCLELLGQYHVIYACTVCMQGRMLCFHSPAIFLKINIKKSLDRDIFFAQSLDRDRHWYVIKAQVRLLVQRASEVLILISGYQISSLLR